MEELDLRPQIPEKPLDPPCILWDLDLDLDLEDTSEAMTWNRSEISDDGCRQCPRTPSHHAANHRANRPLAATF